MYLIFDLATSHKLTECYTDVGYSFLLAAICKQNSDSQIIHDYPIFLQDGYQSASSITTTTLYIHFIVSLYFFIMKNTEISHFIST